MNFASLYSSSDELVVEGDGTYDRKESLLLSPPLHSQLNRSSYEKQRTCSEFCNAGRNNQADSAFELYSSQSDVSDNLYIQSIRTNDFHKRSAALINSDNRSDCREKTVYVQTSVPRGNNADEINNSSESPSYNVQNYPNHEDSDGTVDSPPDGGASVPYISSDWRTSENNPNGGLTQSGQSSTNIPWIGSDPPYQPLRDLSRFDESDDVIGIESVQRRESLTTPTLSVPSTSTSKPCQLSDTTNSSTSTSKPCQFFDTTNSSVNSQQNQKTDKLMTMSKLLPFLK